MIEMDECLKMLAKAYPGFRDEMVKNADSWISGDGEILHFILITSLSDLLLSRISRDNYDHTQELFSVVELLINNGDKQVRELITVGFLESLQNQTDIDSKYWAPLLGRQAISFCKSMDSFYGISDNQYQYGT